MRRDSTGRVLGAVLTTAHLAGIVTAVTVLPPLRGWRLGLFVMVVVVATVAVTRRWGPPRDDLARPGPTVPPSNVPHPTMPDPEGVLDVVGVPLLVYSVDGTCLFANATARRALHLSPSAPLPSSDWPGFRFFAADGETPLAVERRPRSLCAAGQRVDTEVVMMSDDGRTQRLMVQGRPLRDATGAVSAVVITAVDVTELHEQHRLASWQTEQLAAIGEASRAVLREPDARAAMCRSAVTVSGARMTALHEPDDGGNLVATACHGGDLVGCVISQDTPSMLTEAFHSARTLTISDPVHGPRINAALLESWTRNQDHSLLAAAWIPVVNRGRCVGVLSAGFSDAVTDWSARVQALEILAEETAVALERQDLLRRLADEAGSDGLTGAANRRAWDAAFAQRLDHARRSGRPLSVVLIDLDHFKRFNDEHGHLAGDDLLRAAVRAWTERLRPGDLLCRWGGEEFAVLLPSCTLDGARWLAADLLALVPQGQTFSAGVVTWNGRENAQSLTARADAALYAAKAAGRDRIVADATQ